VSPRAHFGRKIIVTTPSKLGIKVHDVLRVLRLIQDVDPGEHADLSMSKKELATWAETAGFGVEVVRQFKMGLNLLLVGQR
jgi:hypothetical protein